MSWVPLESNPEVMNKMLQSFGVPDSWQMVDVYSLDPEILATVPQPVLAVILLFPTTPLTEDTDEAEGDIPKDIIFVKQFINNACGTMALIHSVINNADKIALADGPLKEFMDKAKNLTPEEAGKLLVKSEGLANIHQKLAEEGQTRAPPEGSKVDFHFVTFVQKNGYLYELDGRKKAPVKLGETNENDLLAKAAEEVKKYMQRDPANVTFTVVALTAAG